MLRAIAMGLLVSACLGAPARGEVGPKLAGGVQRLRALHAVHPPGSIRRFAEVIHAHAPAQDLRAEPATASLLGRRVREPVIVRTVEEVVVVRREERPRTAVAFEGHAPRTADCQPDSWLAYHRALNEWHRAGSGMDDRYRRYRAAEAIWNAEATALYGRPPPTAPEFPAPLPRRRRRR